jgi:predicted GNAT family N-acyltransferase
VLASARRGHAIAAMPHPASDAAIVEVDVARILPLRHAVLRPSQPLQAAMFDVDRLPGTVHLAGLLGERVVCCATFATVPFAGEPAHQLRGMATAADQRGLGWGARVLRAGERRCLGASSTALLWCNARVGAVAFYARDGWEIVSAEFAIPGVGPHRVMRKRVSADAAPA